MDSPRRCLLILAAILLIGCQRDIDPDKLLIEQLNDPSPDQRWNAALSLREMQPVPISFLPDLIKALDDSDPRVRRTVAEAIGGLGDDGKLHLNELAKLANEHQDEQVRYALQQSVARIGKTR